MQQQGKKPVWKAALGKYKYVLLVIAAGVVLLLWPSAADRAAGEEETAGQAAAQTADAMQSTRRRWRSSWGRWRVWARCR